MSVVEVSNDTFDEETAGQTVLVVFSATWCGPCWAMAPVLERVAQETGTKLVKIDVDEQPDLVEYFEVTGVPTIILMDDGEPIKTVMGAMSKVTLMNTFGL